MYSSNKPLAVIWIRRTDHKHESELWPEVRAVVVVSTDWTDQHYRYRSAERTSHSWRTTSNCGRHVCHDTVIILYHSLSNMLYCVVVLTAWISCDEHPTNRSFTVRCFSI